MKPTLDELLRMVYNQGEESAVREVFEKLAIVLKHGWGWVHVQVRDSQITLIKEEKTHSFPR